LRGDVIVGTLEFHNDLNGVVKLVLIVRENHPLASWGSPPEMSLQ